jgi:hypothetical protein
MADKTLTGRAITAWLLDQDVEITTNTVSYHRRGECTDCRRSGYLEVQT